MQAAYYLKGIPRSAKTKAAVNMVDTQAEVDHIFDDFVDQTEERARERQAKAYISSVSLTHACPLLLVSDECLFVRVGCFLDVKLSSSKSGKN